MTLNAIAPFFKPSGGTSMDLLRQLKRLLKPIAGGRKLKIGHGGTLDPLASGVMVVGVGTGCRALGTHLGGTKGYRATGLFGAETDTLDSQGQVVATAPHEHVSWDSMEQIVPKFTGDIEQVPPMFSALNHKGKRLHQLAREGIVVERPPRPQHISELTLLRGHTLPEFGFDVQCSGGTYIRTLIDDFGKELGSRAHMTDLVRTRAGQFELDQCLELTDSCTVEDVAKHLSKFGPDGLGV